jgi:hypothetical protein
MSTELAAGAQDLAPSILIREAMRSDVAPEKLRELLAVRREWEADEARKAYNAAITDFQRRAPIIEKGDKAYDKAYARMDRIWREIRPLLAETGLSVTWQICELRGEGAGQLCHVEGMLRHRAGHGERLVQDIPMPEIIKGQNKAQQMGSASTYARRYAMCAALGIVTGDDDDGHSAATTLIDPDEVREINDLLDACRGLAGFNEKAFWGWVGVQAADQIPVARLADVLAMLKRKLGGK